MSALDAFLATWSKARDTFGSGEPQPGDQFDNSAQLHDLQATVGAAGSDEYWSGAAAAAYDGKNAEHARVIGQLADLDRLLGSCVTESARLVTAGRHALDEIKCWTLTAAESVPANPHREQMLMPIAQHGLAVISEVVADFNSRLNTIGKIQVLTTEYGNLGEGTTGPQQSKDEPGLVVMRQNPSVELTADGGPGQVRVGVPEAVVQQTSDGAVRIHYDAANPFAPDIAKNPPWPLQNNPWTVNGDLVFSPTGEGVRVDGTRTNYPSMEVYQDFPDGSSRTVLVDPAIAGNSTGPMVNLPQHHDIGVGGGAFAPFDTGGWNPDFDVRIPLPSTQFGPTTSPPSVPSVPLPSGVTQI